MRTRVILTAVIGVYLIAPDALAEEGSKAIDLKAATQRLESEVAARNDQEAGFRKEISEQAMLIKKKMEELNQKADKAKDEKERTPILQEIMKLKMENARLTEKAMEHDVANYTADVRFAQLRLQIAEKRLEEYRQRIMKSSK